MNIASLATLLVALSANPAIEGEVYRARRLSATPPLTGDVRAQPACATLPAGGGNFVPMKMPDREYNRLPGIGWISVQPSKERPWLPEPFQTRFWIGYDESALYIAIEALDPSAASLEPKAADLGNVFGECSVEVFLHPGRKGPYYQFVVTAGGARWNGMNKGQESNALWEWQAAAHRADGYWSAELAIPWTTLKTKPTPGEAWGMNVGRNLRSPAMRETATWARLTDGFHRPDTFGILIFEGNAAPPRED